MGDVLKFRRPRRKTGTRPPAQSGTIILFTGVWRGRLTDLEASPQQPLRSRRAKRTVARLSEAALPQIDPAGTVTEPDGHAPKPRGRARVSPGDTISR
jgi:hypothetical protein